MRGPDFILVTDAARGTPIFFTQDTDPTTDLTAVEFRAHESFEEIVTKLLPSPPATERS